MSRSFNEDGNPSQIIAAGVTNGYTIDNASRITAINYSGLASNSWTFGYDLLDRVNSGTSTGKTRGYTYDANSNRLTTTGTTASTETISAASNRLSSTAGGIVRTYAYDNAGNTLGFTGETFSFNQRGRMSSATSSAGATNYLYNGLGQLIEKSGNGGTTLPVYDEAGHLLGEYSTTGALVQETIWMGDTPIATLQPNGSSVAIYYVHTDHLGTPRKITRPSDNGLMWRWDPDTFGSVAPNSNPAGLGTFTYNLRFPGQYSLNESGIFYNYFGDYDPSMGRYIESDPIGLQGGINTYAYTSGNPISRIDPPGLDDSICMFNWRMCGPEQMTPVQVLPNTSVSVNLPTPYRLGRVPIIVALKYKSTPSGSSCSIGVGPGNIGANFVPRIGDSVSQTSFGDTSGWGLTSSATLKVPGLPVGYSFSQTNFANGALSISQGPQTVGGQTTISFTYGYTWKW